MQEVQKIWMDGELKDWKEAQIHVLTHALHYGSGVFEGIRFYETPKGAAVFRLKEHTSRFFFSAKSLEMQLPFTEDQINEATLETIRVNNTPAGYIRPLAYYGYGKMGLNPKGAPVNVSIAIWPWGSYLGEGAVKVKTSKYIRIHPDSTVASAKICGHYVNSILSHLDAKNNNFDEALLLDFEGNVAEGPGENVFYVKDGTVVTPPRNNILPGITRDSIKTICDNLSIPFKEEKFTLETLKQADEAFFSGTAAEVTAIGQLDDTIFGSGKIGPVSQKIKETYLSAVKGELSQYDHWLSYV